MRLQHPVARLVILGKDGRKSLSLASRNIYVCKFFLSPHHAFMSAQNSSEDVSLGKSTKPESLN